MPKLIFNNSSVLIEVGQTQDQLTPTYTTAYTASATTCNVKSLSVSRTFNQVDLAGICDTEEKSFNTRQSGQIDIEVYLNSNTVATGGFNGYVFQNAIGKYCRLSFDPDSPVGGVASGLAVQQYVGVITSVSTGVEIDGVLTEKATIKLGVA